MTPRVPPGAPARGWMAGAACAGHERPEIFFPRGVIAARDEALAVCGACPVVEPCRAYRLAIGATYGI